MIDIPSKFKALLSKNPDLDGTVVTTINDFSIWFKDNKLEFFPEYTDHGIDHVNEVLKTAESIITDESWEYITSEDVFVLILSVILHDCAMHLNIDSFIYLINHSEYPRNKSKYIKNDISWITLWNEFMSEALRWDAKKLQAVFGNKNPLRRLDISEEKKLDLTSKDKMLIGEFLRRNHSRLAHEVALNGVPSDNFETLEISFDNIKFLDIAGLIARSHNYDLRKAIDILPSTQKKQYLNCHIPYIMGVLRISDFIQIQSSRAPKQLLKIKKLVSPISRGETYKHIAIDEIHTNDDDPEALFVQVDPNEVKIFILLQELFLNIQEELDSFWALIGEVYGLHKNFSSFGIEIRRIKSNIDNIDTYIKESEPNFVPQKFAFKSAEVEMLNLLVKPLYGDNPKIGIRELVQNAVDACRERHNYLLNHNTVDANKYKNEAKVNIVIEEIDNNKYLLSIHDNGIGMNLHVIKNYFLNIGASFRNSDSWKKENTDDAGKSKIYRTGRFGVGVLAAFLLGSEIEVETRYLNDNDGFIFSCTIEEEFIEVEKKEKQIGTCISIVIDDEVYNKLKDSNEWDWYCLKWPTVNRIFNGKNLKQHYTLKNANENLPEGYYRIEDDNYDDIVWTYQLKTKKKYYENSIFRGLICNGIYVTNYFRHIALRLNIADSPTIKADSPALIIFDQDGVLPLNLQRDDLVGVGGITFFDALQNSVSEVKVNDFIQSLPKMISKSLLVYFSDSKYSFFTYDKWGNSAVFPQIMVHNYQYLPFDNYLIQQSKPEITLLEPVGSSNDSKLWEIYKNNVDSFIPLLKPNTTIKSRISFIRRIFYDNSLEIPISGRCLIIKISEIKELKTKIGSGFTKGILNRKEKYIIDDEWVMYSFGSWEKMTVDLNEVVKIMKENNIYAIGLWNFNWGKKIKLNISPFANAWITKVGSPAFSNN